MGAESVLAGLRPGVVSALIEAGADVDGLRACVNLDAAFALLQPEPEVQPELDCEARARADSELDSQDMPTPETKLMPGSEQ